MQPVAIVARAPKGPSSGGQRTVGVVVPKRGTGASGGASCRVKRILKELSTMRVSATPVNF